MTIQEHPMLNRISGIEEHFRNMFVVDAFIGNPDRNNANWGIIKKKQMDPFLLLRYMITVIVLIIDGIMKQ